jgi:uncharacterized membrane protein YvbJ
MKETQNSRYCASCGKALDSNSCFCPYCGAEVARKNKIISSKIFKRTSLFLEKAGKIENLFIKIVLVVIALALCKIASNLTELQYSIDELRTQLILIWQRL